MDANSAREAATADAPNMTKMHPYTMDAGPPLYKANWKVTAKASQEQRIIRPKLTMESHGMYLYRTVNAQVLILG